MVRFEDVEKDYGDVVALKNASFSIRTEGITGMLGPNGAGKTTAMRIMTGFLAPTAGSVFIDERPFTPDSVEMRRRIGYLPESAPLYSDMLAWDYLVYEARVHSLDPDARVPEVIREVGLGSHAHKPIRELSKGYRQRVGLAHALLHDPELLVLDEPTNGLDPNQILEVRNLIRRIARTKTVIISTHIMQEVEALCDRVLVIHRGRIRFDGAIGKFSASAGSGFQRVRLLVSGISFAGLYDTLAAIPGFYALEELPAERPSDRASGVADEPPGLVAARLTAVEGTDVRPAVFHAARPRFVLYEMVREQTSFEDVFHELTRDKESAEVSEVSDVG